MIKILYAYISKMHHGALQSNVLPMFSCTFQSRMHRLNRWEDVQLSILGRLLLLYGTRRNRITVNEVDVQFNYFKKPYFRDIDVHFSISHSYNIVVCGLSSLSEIGIDIEKKSSG